LTQKELAKIVFPLGEYKKTEVKKLAKKSKLPIFGDEESQDICFLSGTDINSFLKKYIKPKIGNIVDESGKIIAEHKGLPFYTIGQRKGIEIGGTGPYFVIEKNSRKNELIVSNDPKKLLVKKFEVNRVSWVNDGIRLPLHARIQVRYHASKISAKISSGKAKKLVVEAENPLRAVTSGQSAVFYKNSEVLGGGIIV
jgi:tRNA-specific 2-thiouridylase